MNNIPTILFVYIYASQGYTRESFSKYFGAAILQAFLKKKGISFRQFCETESASISSTAVKIIDTGAKCVGFTCHDANYYYSKLLAEAIKDTDPEITIIFGGPSATFSDRLIMEDCDAIDVCFRGESEFALHEFLSRTANEDSGIIKGISYRKNEQLVRNEDRPLAFYEPRGAQLDIFPSPYSSGIIDDSWPDLFPVQTVRGCRFNCTYCNFPGISGHRLRYYSVERVMEDFRIIKHLVEKTGERLVTVFDDSFCGNAKRAKQVCEALIKEGIRLPLSADIRVENVDRDLFKMMREIGFVQLNIGLESANPRIIRNVNKILTMNHSDPEYVLEKKYIENISRALKWAGEENLDVSISIIQGLPGERIKEAYETLEYVKKLGVKRYSHNRLNIFPGTRLFDDHERFGIRIEKSATTLPYETIPAYNLEDVTPLKNSDSYLLAKRISYEIISRFWGAIGIFDDFFELDRYILFDEFIGVENQLFEWMKSFGLFFDKVAFRSTKEMNTKQMRELREQATRYKMPTQQIYFFVPDRSVSATGNIKSQQWRQVYSSLYKPMNHITPLVKVVGMEDDAVVSKIPDYQTVMTFLGMNNSVSSEDEVFNLGKKLIKNEAMLEDGCRWAEALCPGVHFRRIIVNGLGEVHPCFSSCRKGSNWRSPDYMRERWRSEIEAESVRRGCKNCPVEKTCSKCLCPNPFSVDLFCEIKRKGRLSDLYQNLIKLNVISWKKA